MKEDSISISSIDRLVAVHAVDQNFDATLASAVSSCNNCQSCKIIVFAPQSAMKSDVSVALQVPFPLSADTIPKQKNFILKWCESQNFSGFLHLVETCIRFNSRTQSYMDKLESTINVFDYNVHLSTITDKCNYIFNKFSPRLIIDIDDDNIKQRLDLPDKLFFTSHSNIAYITFNFKKLRNQLPLFNENFTIGMFYIIEFLARRRALSKPGQLYYMNQYLSISNEIGAYDIVSTSNENIDNQKMQEENELFKSLNINYAPDNNIDIVLDALYSKLKSKIA